ncbi:LPXTG cell wall anchor domain-containing protein [Plantactinospora sonchi]|uniref:LPXTG cell wall anchor domain-containing protein n=1 Tax=Plantactinospora sonchi TaxID=1544735 RepID=A0ABU7S456_9ACTN
MRPSHHGHVSARSGPRRRVLAVVATLTVFGGLVGVTQTSNAGTERALAGQRAPVGCDPTSAPASTGTSEDAGGAGTATEGASPSASAPPDAVECEEQDGGEETPATPGAGSGSPSAGAPGNGLEPLGDNCDNSRLAAHTGFQEGDRCVSTAFGELGAAEQNPTLLIAEAPETVRAGERFRIVVSTRNLVRDRFLPAAQGGYYRESSLLNEEGLVRGHFHTSCRMLTSTNAAAEPAPVPAFFVATEDGKGGKEPDLVIVEVPGLPAGLAQCSSWAGDGSHRIPMMARANQIPALDSVRIWVQPAENDPPADDPGDNNPPADDPGDDNPPADNPGDDQPPADQPGDNNPPADDPGDDNPPADNPGDDQPPADQPGDDNPPADNPGDDNPPADQPGDNNPPANQPGGQPPAQQPDDDDEQSGNGQQPGGQQPEPEKSSGRPTPEATKPTPDGADAVAEPPVRQTNAGGSGGGLALTGANTIGFMVGGVLLLIAGTALLYLTRRRRAVRR